jgi:hypothetical protein
VTGGPGAAAAPSGPEPSPPVDDKAAPVVDPGRLPAGQQRLAALVASRPDVFTGLYRDGKVWAVVLGPAAGDGGPGGWPALLGRAAGSTPVRIERCDLSGSDLLSLQAQVTGVSWPSGRPGFSTSPDPRACAVTVTGQQFSAADRRLMTERFGDRVRLDTSFQPRRVPGASRP